MQLAHSLELDLYPWRLLRKTYASSEQVLGVSDVELRLVRHPGAGRLQSGAASTVLTALTRRRVECIVSE